MKLKAILPSLREKKQYIAFEVEKPENIGLKETRNAIMASTKNLIGDLGMAKAGILFLKDWKDQKGILRVNSKYVNYTKASMALITEISGKKARIKSVGVSGVVNKVRESHF